MACAICGNPSSSRGAKYCALHREVGRGNARQATAEANRERWQKWREQGIDPTHGGRAAERRSSSISLSNKNRIKKPGPSYKLKPREQKLAVEMYKQGHGANSIALRLKVDTKTILHLLDRHGVAHRSRSEAQQYRRVLHPVPRTFTINDKIIKRYVEDEETCAEIAASLGVSDAIVHRRLKEAGVQMRPPGKRRKE